eukprot:GHUV01014417.1.p1 GENE.GHUV01014417.1~~GHUV01014417.1.p1  ORF type:complete len:370 (+),score=88.65 GHUV01014417.1:1172-2281(+)
MFSCYVLAQPASIRHCTTCSTLPPRRCFVFCLAAFPTAALVATMLAVEFGIMHKKQSLTQSLQAFCHTFWMALVGFTVVLAVTEATKPVASRYRPDFLQRCLGTYDPSIPSNSKGIILPEECKGVDLAALADGRKSFPSGHSANTLSICWYCVVYLIHALYFRQGFYHMGGLGAKAYSSSGKWYQKIIMEALQGLLLLWLCVVLCIAWWIGVSRFTDHRHNIDDILGGFTAALLWMTPIAIIAMYQLSYYHKSMTKDGTGDDHDLQLPLANIPTSSKSASVPAVSAATIGTRGVNGAAASTAAVYGCDNSKSVGAAGTPVEMIAGDRLAVGRIPDEGEMVQHAAAPGTGSSAAYNSAVLQHLTSVKQTM